MLAWAALGTGSAIGSLATLISYATAALSRLVQFSADARRWSSPVGPCMLNNLLSGLFFKIDVTLLEPLQRAGHRCQVQHGL